MKRFLPIVSLALLLGAPLAQADTLVLEDMSAPAATATPTRGMSMERVLSQFGEPQERISPVGEPPIARWIYDDYTVYFERNLVLHAVARR